MARAAIGSEAPHQPTIYRGPGPDGFSPPLTYQLGSISV